MSEKTTEQVLLDKNGDLVGSPSEKALRAAHRRVMRHHGHTPDGVLEADMVREFLSIQVDEITRLEARLAAAEKLAETVERVRMIQEQSLRTADFHSPACKCPRCADDAMFAALSTFRESKG